MEKLSLCEDYEKGEERSVGRCVYCKNNNLTPSAFSTPSLALDVGSDGVGDCDALDLVKSDLGGKFETVSEEEFIRLLVYCQSVCDRNGFTAPMLLRASVFDSVFDID